MSARIIDISGRLLDESIREDLAIVCRDIEVANQQCEHWAHIEHQLGVMLKSAMETVGLVYFETETLTATIEDGELVLEGKEGSSCELH